MFSECAAVQHFAFNIVAMNRPHLKLNASIGQQHPCSRCNFASKLGKIAGNQRCGSHHFARRYRQHGTGFEQDILPVLQQASANLGALKVLKNADRPLQLLRGPAKPLDSAGMFGMSSMRKVETRNIHARKHQVANHFFGITRRPNSANDFCASHPSGHLVRATARWEIAFNQVQFAFFQLQILSPETVITIDYFQEGVTSEAVWDSAGARLIVSEFLRLPADAELSSVRADRSWH